MPNKQMYFSLDIYTKLTKEENASALVTKLLLAHWEEVDNPYAHMNKEQIDKELERAEILNNAQDKIDKLFPEEVAK